MNTAAAPSPEPWEEAGRYHIKREQDAPFTFSLYGVRVNPGSTLQRESVLFNDPTCPVVIARNRTTFGYDDRRFQLSANTAVNFAQPVVAVEIRHILFDVFGRHMQNLAALDVQDFTPGPRSLEGTWNIFDDNNTGELLTTVTYVARARLEDGTQWVFNEKSLFTALGSLRLEKKIGEEVDEPPKPS